MPDQLEIAALFSLIFNAIYHFALIVIAGLLTIITKSLLDMQKKVVDLHEALLGKDAKDDDGIYKWQMEPSLKQLLRDSGSWMNSISDKIRDLWNATRSMERNCNRQSEKIAQTSKDCMEEVKEIKSEILTHLDKE